ncbi:SHOCT domain-containing protein [Halobacillus shinanisalinarum]|uniref:SHOCT domain-containing protein n=1 Tax=Halobacillus shinanisalinarum TaxID=2932258 RepID=A0ABY4H4W6_9BACI|nr:SHOCT domain-containing protein [Halobacillus shinanisalinarum]UOQ94012.1 SHOCT domain-containing protein [Halobacillus shinanisalinarum]
MMMGPIGMIIWIIIIGFIIYGIIQLITKSFERKEDPSLQILKERYAKGEISEQEYEERKNTLER